MTSTTETSASRGPDAAARPARIAVVGVHGYGAAHVLTVQALERSGQARLVGLVDTADGPIYREGKRVGGDLPRILPSLEDLLDSTQVDIVAIATPLHTHAELASRVLLAGADVLLEKPPVTDLTAFEALSEVQRRTGGLVQVGFQSLGSLALAELRRVISQGQLGTIEAIGAGGSWTRDRAYWDRAPWAGRRMLNGHRVSDGAVSNPFAHAVMTALTVAGWNAPDAIGSVETDLHRANAIEVDDTSVVRVLPSTAGKATFDGILTCAFTLAGPREDDPFVMVRGSKGTAVLHYTEDRLTLPASGARRFGRVDLMQNLMDARAESAELLSPLSATGAFVSVIEAVGAAPVHAIEQENVRWRGAGEHAHPVIPGIVENIELALSRERFFRELPEASWAR